MRPELRGWTYSELAALIQEVSMQAVIEATAHFTLASDDVPHVPQVNSVHVEMALDIVLRSDSAKVSEFI